MKISIALLLLIITTTSSAVEIYDKETGKYLGQLGGNQYAPDSTNNPYATNPPVIIDTNR